MQQKNLYQNKNTRAELDLSKTFANLKAEVDKLRIIEPPKEEGAKPKVKEAIKGNVYNTAKEIYRLLIKETKRSKRKVMALRTKNPSLGKLCRSSARTIQRHIEKLVEYGILQAKARLNNGIQLLLNPDIVGYIDRPAPNHPVVKLADSKLTASTAPAAANLEEMRQRMSGKFSMKNALGTP